MLSYEHFFEEIVLLCLSKCLDKLVFVVLKGSVHYYNFNRGRIS